jgi:signal transduction histidine kinase
MFSLTSWETIPFHNVWVSLALLYTVRRWSFSVTAAVLLCVMVAVGAALAYVVVGAGDAGVDEMAEVPMMAAMFAVIVFYAWRHDLAMKKVQESAERERDFIRDVSHYLRTPITVALGHAELIRAGATDTQLTEDAEIVVDELKRVSTISDRLLLLAMPQDDLVIVREAVDPGQLVRTMARRWSAAANRSWEVEVTTEGTVLADEERLTLALDCLVENAVRATDEGQTIAIRSRSRAGRAVLEVSDTGVGISPEDQERIFERFRRAPSNGGQRSGAGLGLALARAIAEAHGGSLEVESSPGRGATFRIRLGALRPRALPVRATANLGNGDGVEESESADLATGSRV